MQIATDPPIGLIITVKGEGKRFLYGNLICRYTLPKHNLTFMLIVYAV